MSLVGTRPILQDELRQYELHHRARIAIKPGITGMWQVSGRSDITDFEEVVRLDTEYISKGLADYLKKHFKEPSVAIGYWRCSNNHIKFCGRRIGALQGMGVTWGSDPIKKQLS